MKLTIPTRVAEILFALAMIIFGVWHLRYGSAGGGVPTYMPGDPSIWMYVTGAGFLAAGVAILINKFKKLACYLLALMLLVFILTIHVPQVMKDHNPFQLLKDGALAMAAIIIGNSSSK